MSAPGFDSLAALSIVGGDLGRDVTAWLATYLLHSTALLLCAWAAGRFIAAPRRREILWRAALFGGLVTASAQTASDRAPALGRFALGNGADGVPASEPPSAAPLEGRVARTSAPPEPALLADFAEEHALPPAPYGPIEARLDRFGPTALALGAAFAFGSLALGAGILARRRRFQRAIRTGPLAACLAELQRARSVRRRIRLVVCSRSETPHATGVLAPRIVLTERAIRELDHDELRAVLAHELAHLERLDPLWLGLTRAMQLFVPLQPLNAVARRKLAACAELLCDERAIARTGDRVALARSLTKVASWIVAEDALPDAACAMASRRSLLGLRVERILAEDSPRRVSEPGWRVLAALALAGTAAALPAVRASEPAEVEPEPAPPSAAFAPAGGAPARAELHAVLESLAESVDEELAALGSELERLRGVVASRELSRELAGRVERLEQRASALRARAIKIRALLEAGPVHGVEAPRNEGSRPAGSLTSPNR